MGAPFFYELLDSDPDGFAPTLGLDYLLLQPMQPDARVNYLTYKLVLAHKYAPFGILGGVARMDADALPLAVELVVAKQDW